MFQLDQQYLEEIKRRRREQEAAGLSGVPKQDPYEVDQQTTRTTEGPDANWNQGTSWYDNVKVGASTDGASFDNRPPSNVPGIIPQARSNYQYDGGQDQQRNIAGGANQPPAMMGSVSPSGIATGQNPNIDEIIRQQAMAQVPQTATQSGSPNAAMIAGGGVVSDAYLTPTESGLNMATRGAQPLPESQAAIPAQEMDIGFGPGNYQPTATSAAVPGAPAASPAQEMDIGFGPGNYQPTATPQTQPPQELQKPEPGTAGYGEYVLGDPNASPKDKFSAIASDPSIPMDEKVAKLKLLGDDIKKEQQLQKWVNEYVTAQTTGDQKTIRRLEKEDEIRKQNSDGGSVLKYLMFSLLGNVDGMRNEAEKLGWNSRITTNKDSSGNPYVVKIRPDGTPIYGEYYDGTPVDQNQLQQSMMIGAKRVFESMVVGSDGNLYQRTVQGDIIDPSTKTPMPEGVRVIGTAKAQQDIDVAREKALIDLRKERVRTGTNTPENDINDAASLGYSVDQWRKRVGQETTDTPSTAGTGRTISERNNNPGNLVDKNNQFRVFDTEEEGRAALEQDLASKLSGNSDSYKKRFGDQPVTPERLAEVWSPAAAKGNSVESTRNYGESIAKALGIKPGDTIPNTPEAIQKTADAITRFERGPDSGKPTERVSTQPKTSIVSATESEKVRGKNLAETEFNQGKLESGADNMLFIIEDIRTHPGFKSVVGVPDILTGIIKPPGTDSRGAVAKMKQLNGALFLQAYETLKGGGHITEIEGQKATEAMAALNDPYVKEKEYLRNLQILENTIKRGINRQRQKLDQEPKYENVPTVQQEIEEMKKMRSEDADRRKKGSGGIKIISREKI
jgi:hypothetical protein